MGDNTPPPTGRAQRFFKLGALSTRVAASYMKSSIGSVFRSPEGKLEARKRTHAKNAARVAGVMSELKGAVMKVGQLLSTQDGIVPAELRDTLAQFHCQAPPMHFAFVRDVVEAELGKPLAELYAEVDTQPLAAASLGQVHRAKLRTGEDVVIKVQYPGIEETIESDLGNLRRIVRSLRVAGGAYDLSEAFEEVRETLLREADYEEEGRSLERFRAALAGADKVVVPRLYPELSARRVLTLDYLQGRHLDEFCAAVPDPERRKDIGQRLAMTIWELEFCHGLLHADPHPGNYLFMEDERLGLLDFGCVKTFTPEFLASYRGAVEGILAGDDERIIESYLAMRFMKPEERGTKLEAAYLEWSYLSCEPLLYDGVWAGSWEDFLKRLHDHMNGMALKLGFYMPKEAVYLNRVMLGVMCFWNRLDVRLDWGRLVRQVLDRPVTLVA